MNAHPLEVELPAIIEAHIRRQPRNHQARVGPSEIGTPCLRKLGYKTLGIAPTEPAAVPWKAWIGTAVHNELAMVFELHAMANHQGGRWHIEQKVTAGVTPAGDLDGSSDLYDEHTATVVDWKITSKNRLADVRRTGPGSTYRVQAHTYGAGWAARGHPVEHVAVMFFTRDGQFTDRYWWSEPFDPSVAANALARLSAIELVAGALGPGVLPLLGTAPDYCRTSCPAYVPDSTDLATGCPGDPSLTTAITTTLAGLLAGTNRKAPA